MKKLLSYLLLSLVVVVLLLMVVSASAQTTRIKLTQIEKSNTVNGTKANQLPLSNGVGDLRYAQYTEINPVSIGYTPALTGNPVANYAQFVKPANGDVWYIDNEGRGIRLYVAASAGDYDWLEIANNQIPNAITDSIYKYKYASIGGRLVWPTAEMLVIDSVAQGMFIVAGDRKAKVALYDTNNQTWCTLEQGGGTTALIMQDQGTFSIQTAGSGTPQAPGTPIVEHFNILGDSSIQFPQYPNTRLDSGTPTVVFGPDATGRMKNYPAGTINGVVTSGPLTGSGSSFFPVTVLNNSLDSQYIKPLGIVNSDIKDVAPLKLLQSGATIGQALVWDGTKYAPNNVSNTNTNRENISLSQFVNNNAINVDSLYYKTDLNTIEVAVPYGDGDAVYMKLQGFDDFRHFVDIYGGLQIDGINLTSKTGTWVTGNSISYATNIGATFTTTFTGKSFYFQYYSDPTGGRWRFVLDGGVAVDTVDTYRDPAVLLNRELLFSNLSNTTHTVVATLISSNPLSSGNKGWILNYTPGVNDISSYSTVLTNSTTVLDFVTDDYKIQRDASYYEFAINIRPANNPSLPVQWIPSHGGQHTCFYTGDSLKIYVDGTRQTTTQSLFKKAGQLTLSQELNGFYIDSISPGKEYANIKISHNFKGDAVNILNEIKWKRNTFGTGYLMMGPISTANYDTLYTSLYQKLDLDNTGGGNEDILYQNQTNEFLFQSNTRPVNVLQTVNDGGIKRPTKINVRNPLYFLEHRNSSLQKLYAQSFSSETMLKSESDWSNFTLRFYKKAAFGSVYKSPPGGGAAQVLSRSNGTVSLSGGGGSINLPDSSATNELQTLSIAGQDLTLSNGGGTVTIPSGSGIGGSGTANTIPKFATTTTIGNSTITDDGVRVNITGTGETRIPVGTDAQRLGTPVDGDIRVSSTNNNFEFRANGNWEYPMKSLSPTGLTSSTLIPYGHTDGRYTSNSNFLYNGASSGLIVNALQLNGGGTSTSFTGQGFAVAGSNRQLRVLVSGANSDAADPSAYYLRIGNISRTTGTSWVGFDEDMLQIQSGSTITDFTFKRQRSVYNRAMTTVIGNDYDAVFNAGVTNHYAQIWRSGSVGLGTTTPAYIFDIVNPGAIRIPAGTTAQQPTGSAGVMRFNTTTGNAEGVRLGTTYENFVMGTASSIYTGTSPSLDFPSMTTGTGAVLTFSDLNAAIGDVISVGNPFASGGSYTFSAGCSTAGTVWINVVYWGAGSGDPGASTFKYTITK